jgi:hypothetical protein
VWPCGETEKDRARTRRRSRSLVVSSAGALITFLLIAMPVAFYLTHCYIFTGFAVSQETLPGTSDLLPATYSLVSWAAVEPVER